jgi:pantetheine-phosphate adenylyltransferase
MKKAIYPGSFDPITKGHIDVIKKAIELCDVLYVVVAINENKKHMFDINTRAEIVNKAISEIKVPIGKKIEIITFGGIISNLALKLDIDIMIRGIRDHVDLSYELNIEQFTKGTAKNVITVYFTAEAENVYTSSSLIRQFIISNNIDKIKKLVPIGTFDLISEVGAKMIDKKLSDTIDYEAVWTYNGARLH